ncbi:MAG: hypothetical protein V2B14_03375 [bacterium]
MNLLNFFKSIKSILKYFNRSKKFLEKDFPLKKVKTFLTSNDILQINGSIKLDVEEINKEAKEVLKKYINNPEGLLKFIESKGTTVIRMPHVEKFLSLIGEDEGFIMPLNGFKAILLTTMINILSKTQIKIKNETSEMFVIRNKPVNIYFLIHQYHHWLTYMEGLPGYEEKTVNNFKSLWIPNFGMANINKMSLGEILSLKEAIERDIEAIDFVKEITRELIGAKKCINRLKTQGNVSL